jgi:peptidoglycan/LPS O-acetylase OafA/YrhL
MRYRSDIDGLRAVAVLPVVLYHAGIPGLSGGYLGVDVFFVISGYLITSIVADEIDSNRFSLIGFYERRARRILPALTAVVLATFFVGWFVLLPTEFQNLGQSALATAFFLSNVYFTFTLSYFTSAAEFAPLLHTWSLAVEEQFYLFFPPLLILLFGWRGRRAAIWAIAGVSLLSLLAAVVMLPIRSNWVFYLIVFRAWELGAGALLALASLNAPRRRATREALGVAGLLGILIPVTVYDANTPFPGLAAVPPVLGAALLIYIGANGSRSMVSAMLANRVLVWIGLISYSLYLWHWPILAFLRIASGDATLPLTRGLIAVAASVAVAWFSYRFIESPFRSRPPRGFGRRAIFSASAAALAGIVAMGGLMHVTEGMPVRLPAAVAAVAATAEDWNPRREDCFENRPDDGLCTIGASARGEEPIDFLFWGDSHAEAMVPGVHLAARSAGQHGLYAAHRACPPIRELRRVPEIPGCADFNDAVWAFLESRSDIPLVILAARWTLSVEGTRYLGEAGPSVMLEWAGDAAARPERSDNPALVEAGLMATIKAIRETGRAVVIIGPMPEVGWNVPLVSSRNLLFGWPVPADIPRTAYDSRAGRTETILGRIAAAVEGVRYLPLSDIVCGSRACLIHDEEGLPLYVDDDHISRSAAERVLAGPLSEIWLATSERSVWRGRF